MIKHIIFDFGGVILDLGGKHSTFAEDLAYIFEISLEKAREIWKENKNDLVCGRETPKDFLERINRILKADRDVNQAYALWTYRHKMERENINWELVTLIEKLKEKYQIHMLTDQVDLDHQAKEWIHEVEGHFQNIYRSYKEKMRKPDPRAFLNVLDKIHAEAEECVFIDDLAQNVKTAHDLGMYGIQFTDNESLKTELKKLHIDF